MSLFCRSFSVEVAAEVLGVDSSEALIKLEGLRNSEVLTVDADVKELTYDIHPLLRTFLRSISSASTLIHRPNLFWNLTHLYGKTQSQLVYCCLAISICQNSIGLTMKQQQLQ